MIKSCNNCALVIRYRERGIDKMCCENHDGQDGYEVICSPPFNSVCINWTEDKSDRNGTDEE